MQIPLAQTCFLPLSSALLLLLLRRKPANRGRGVVKLRGLRGSEAATPRLKGQRERRASAEEEPRAREA